MAKEQKTEVGAQLRDPTAAAKGEPPKDGPAASDAPKDAAKSDVTKDATAAAATSEVSKEAPKDLSSEAAKSKAAPDLSSEPVKSKAATAKAEPPKADDSGAPRKSREPVVSHYEIAKRVSLTSKRGLLREGTRVSERDFSGGQASFDEHVAAKRIVPVLAES